MAFETEESGGISARHLHAGIDDADRPVLSSSTTGLEEANAGQRAPVDLGAEFREVALDEANIAVALVDQRGTLITCNRRFRAELAGGKLQVINNIVVVENVTSPIGFKNALSMATAQLTPRESLLLIPGADPLSSPISLTIKPYVVGPYTADAAGTKRFALLLMRSRSRSAADLQHLLCSALEFTPTEADLAQHLIAGQSPKEYAESRNTSIRTVRWHLSSLLQKTNTTRQAELIAFLLRACFF